MAPANQSRFSDERGPPQEFWTERVRAGQAERARAMERSNLDWIFSRLVSVLGWRGAERSGKGSHLGMEEVRPRPLKQVGALGFVEMLPLLAGL